MTLEEIFKAGHIGVRSFNVCNDSGLRCLDDILNYFEQKKTFDNLRNCGKKSNEELKALCFRFKKLGDVTNVDAPNPKDSLRNVVVNLSGIQRDIINNFIETNFKLLKTRSRNALFSFLSGNLKVRHFTDMILTNEGFDPYKIDNVGAQSSAEINRFIEAVKDFMEKVSKLENEVALKSLKTRIFFQESFPSAGIPEHVLQTQSIFTLTDFLINNSLIYERKQNVVFLNSLKLFSERQELTRDEIAAKCGLTRERVRQIQSACLGDLFDKFNFVKIVDEDLLIKYGVDQDEDFVVVDAALQKNINEINGTNFSQEFLSCLLYVYTSDRFKLVGNLEDVLQTKNNMASNRHNWKHFILVNSRLADVFDFVAMADDIRKRVDSRIEATYKLDFTGYLQKFLRSKDSSVLIRIKPVAERIINLEFLPMLEDDGSIVFSRNTIKQVHEYAVDALEDLGGPSHLDEIYNLIESKFPGVTKSTEALRGSLQRSPEIICFGRSSTYGLKKWELEDENIRGGTIRQLVAKYLEMYDEPRDLEDLTNYVLQYRSTTSGYSITQNLKLDQSGAFIFFQDNMIGLTYRRYNSCYIPLSSEAKVDRKPWEERLEDLKAFIKLNGRLPYSSGCPAEEIKLHRWRADQMRKMREEMLDPERSLMMTELEDSGSIENCELVSLN